MTNTSNPIKTCNFGQIIIILEGMTIFTPSLFRLSLLSCESSLGSSSIPIFGNDKGSLFFFLNGLRGSFQCICCVLNDFLC